MKIDRNEREREKNNIMTLWISFGTSSQKISNNIEDLQQPL